MLVLKSLEHVLGSVDEAGGPLTTLLITDLLSFRLMSLTLKDLHTRKTPWSVFQDGSIVIDISTSLTVK